MGRFFSLPEIRIAGLPARTVLLPVLVGWMILAQVAASRAETPPALVEVTFPETLIQGSVDGRVLLIIAPADSKDEPRFLVDGTLASAQVVGIDVEAWRSGEPARFGPEDFGYPIRSPSDLPAGDYKIQAMLHRYETFKPAHGHTIKLPMDRGQGQMRFPITTIRMRSIPPISAPMATRSPMS